MGCRLSFIDEDITEWHKKVCELVLVQEMDVLSTRYNYLVVFIRLMDCSRCSITTVLLLTSHNILFVAQTSQSMPSNHNAKVIVYCISHRSAA